LTLPGSSALILGVIEDVTTFPASFIFGLLYKKFGAMVAFGTGAIITCISVLLFVIFVKEQSKKLGP